MSDKENGDRLPIWEDLDIDFDRAKSNGEKRAKVLSNSEKVDLREYLNQEKARYDKLEKNFKWR